MKFAFVKLVACQLKNVQLTHLLMHMSAIDKLVWKWNVQVVFLIFILLCGSFIFFNCRKVAKKIFVGNLQPDETVDANQEASFLRHLDHPNIVRFYDSFIEAEFFYIVTEYCEVVFLWNEFA